MRIRGKPASIAADLATEVVEVVFGQTPFQECSRVDARGGMALEVDVVAGCAVVFAAEEVVESDLIERGGAGEG